MSIGQPARFAAVGIGATLLHILVGTWLIRSGAAAPMANLLAFMLAFLFSFLGHHYFSFRRHGQRIRQTLRRFALVALAGFALNQTLLLVLLRWLPAEVTLPVVVLFVAGLTYLASRHWAFGRSRKVTGPCP